MKVRMSGPVLLVLVACVSVSLGVINIRGVMYTGSYVAGIDSVIFTGRITERIVPTGWAGDSMRYDTFDFVGIDGWPGDIRAYATMNGEGQRVTLRPPVPDSWYVFMELPPTEPMVKFAIIGTGAEERAPVAPARLRAGASVFAGAVTLVATLPRAGRAVVEVFDGTGRLVRTLADRTFAAGEQRLAWDRCDAEGREVGTGIYLARLSAGASRSLAKLVLVD